MQPVLWCLVLVALVPGAVPEVIQLRTATIDTATTRRAQLPSPEVAQFIITVESRPGQPHTFTPARRQAFERQFGRAGPPIPQHSFIFVGPGHSEEPLRLFPGVTAVPPPAPPLTCSSQVIAVTSMHPEHKISPELAVSLQRLSDKASEDRFGFAGALWQDSANTVAKLRKILHQRGAEHVQILLVSLALTATCARLTGWQVSDAKMICWVSARDASVAVAAAASLPHVTWLGLMPRDKLLDVFASALIYTDAVVNGPDLAAAGLDGRGQVWHPY